MTLSRSDRFMTMDPIRTRQNFVRFAKLSAMSFVAQMRTVIFISAKFCRTVALQKRLLPASGRANFDKRLIRQISRQLIFTPTVSGLLCLSAENYHFDYLVASVDQNFR